MNQQISGADSAPEGTTVERQGDRGLVITRMFDAPRSLVYKAWSEADLFRRWWVPKSAPGISLVTCEMDVRTGGRYRLEFGAGGSDTMAFHGRYLEVIPDERIVWTNDEDAAGAITTVTFEDAESKTLVRFHEAYPSSEALEAALQGSSEALPEQLAQLGEVLLELRP